MSDNDSPARLRQRSTALIAGAALMCGAGVLGLAGLGLTTAALVAAARVRMSRMPVPPRELARRTWTQAKAATAAGRNAWRDVTVPPMMPSGDGSRTTADRPLV
jgi:hypothetical protein